MYDFCEPLKVMLVLTRLPLAKIFSESAIRETLALMISTQNATLAQELRGAADNDATKAETRDEPLRQLPSTQSTRHILKLAPDFQGNEMVSTALGSFCSRARIGQPVPRNKIENIERSCYLPCFCLRQAHKVSQSCI